MDNPFEALEARLAGIERSMLGFEKSMLYIKQHVKAESTEKLLSIEEAADVLNLTVRSVYTEVDRGELPERKRGDRLYFSDRDLMKYFKKRLRVASARIEQEAENCLNHKKKEVVNNGI